MTDPQPDPHADYLALLDRLFERWPDMRRYADTARRERLEYWIKDGVGRWQKHWCWTITVTAFDKSTDEAQT